MKKINLNLLLKYLISLAFILITFFLDAQVKTKIFADSVPQSLKPSKGPIGKIIQFEPPDNFERLKSDQIKDPDNGIERRNQFAASLQTNINFMSIAEKTDENSFTTFSLTIIAKQALNISLEFADFELSPNSNLSIFTKKELTDGVTSKQNNQNKIWATRVYQGNTLNIVLKFPTSEIMKSSFRVTKVNFGFKSFGAEYGNPGTSAGCNINVICPQGNGWESERNSVSLIVANGQESCTGALIMNTCSTDIPYLLTANHCLDANVANWVFQFQYWSSTCTPNSGWTEDIQFNGCILRANHAASDFALLQLNQTPPTNSNIRYAGWSRQTTGITSTTILQHPGGDLQKIAIDNNAPNMTNFLGADCWQLGLDIGATEGGTSGSPYFNQDHRIIAQHYGTGQGQLPICDRTEKYGGRFHLSWTGGGTNATRLSNWLDPINSGAMTTNTTNVSALVAGNPTLTISGSPTNDYICSGSSTYTLSGLPVSASVCWSLSNSYASIPNPSCNSSVVVTVQGAGFTTLTANVTLCDGQIRTIDKKIMIGAAVEGYYIINSNYHQPIQRPLYTNNSPIWLPANQSFSVYAQITSLPQSPSWTKNPNSYNFSWSQSGVTLNFSGTSGSTAYTTRNGIFDFTAQTSCGTYTGTFTWPVIVQGWGFRIIVSPNPAKSNLLVSIQDESLDLNKLRKEESIIMTLYDLNSTIVTKRWNFNNSHRKFNLDLNGVKSGQYILVVKKGKYQQSRQIIIEK